MKYLLEIRRRDQDWAKYSEGLLDDCLEDFFFFRNYHDSDIVEVRLSYKKNDS